MKNAPFLVWDWNFLIEIPTSPPLPPKIKPSVRPCPYYFCLPRIIFPLLWAPYRAILKSKVFIIKKFIFFHIRLKLDPLLASLTCIYYIHKYTFENCNEYRYWNNNKTQKINRVCPLWSILFCFITRIVLIWIKNYIGKISTHTELPGVQAENCFKAAGWRHFIVSN